MTDDLVSLEVARFAVAIEVALSADTLSEPGVHAVIHPLERGACGKLSAPDGSCGDLLDDMDDLVIDLRRAVEDFDQIGGAAASVAAHALKIASLMACLPEPSVRLAVMQRIGGMVGALAPFQKNTASDAAFVSREFARMLEAMASGDPNQIRGVACGMAAACALIAMGENYADT